jgi:hypothetical protein
MLLSPLSRDEREGAAMPHGRCVIYMSPGDPKEIIGKARTGLLPIFKEQPGFIAYGVMVRGDHLISMSAWRSESDAKAADELARQWVAENVDLTVVESFLGDYEWLEFAEQ